MIEVICFVEQREGRDGGAKFLTDDVVRSPEPVRGEHLIAALNVVVDGGAQSSRSACRCDSGEIARRTLAGECNINRCLEILRKPRDRRIGDIVLDGEGAEDALDRRQVCQFTAVIHNGTDCRVDHAFLTVLCDCSAARRIGSEDRVLQAARCRV